MSKAFQTFKEPASSRFHDFREQNNLFIVYYLQRRVDMMDYWIILDISKIINIRRKSEISNSSEIYNSIMKHNKSVLWSTRWQPIRHKLRTMSDVYVVIQI